MKRHVPSRHRTWEAHFRKAAPPERCVTGYPSPKSVPSWKKPGCCAKKCLQERSFLREFRQSWEWPGLFLQMQVLCRTEGLIERRPSKGSEGRIKLFKPEA